MNCLVEDSQWLDSFQTRVLSNATESSTCSERLSNKDKPNTVGDEITDRTTCISACIESESPCFSYMKQSSRSSYPEKNCVVEGQSAGLKRKWDVDTGGQFQRPPQELNGMYRPIMHGHDIVEQNGRDLSLEHAAFFPAHIHARRPLDAAVADGLPAPEFVKLGRSSIAAETHRMVCTAIAASAAPQGATSPPE